MRAITNIIIRLEKGIKIRDFKGAAKIRAKDKGVDIRPREGDVFGARALEAGYFGGIAESRPSSLSSSDVLSPSIALVDWSGAVKEGFHSSSSSTISLPTPVLATKKPSPLRLQPSEVEWSANLTHSPTARLGGGGGAYMSPLPSLRSILTNNSRAKSGWVSPLDFHFSQPATTNSVTSARPTSYLPRFQFPEEFAKDEILRSVASVGGAKSEPGSIISSATSQASTPKPGVSRRLPSPTFSFFQPTAKASDALVPPQVPSPAFSVASSPIGSSHLGGQDGHSIVTLSDESNHLLSPRKSDSIQLRSIPSPFHSPQNISPPKSPLIDSNLFPENPTWTGERAVFRESIVSKRTVSVYRPKSYIAESSVTHKREQSGASSVHSTRTSIVDHSGVHSQKRSQSIENQAKQRSRSRSTSQKGTRSSRSLARTKDSIRHSRKSSKKSLTSGKRMSRHRDRNRSGSIQGRAFNFHNPSESPFSNVNAIRTYSAKSSTSSTSSFGNAEPLPPLPRAMIEVELLESDRLSALPLNGDRIMGSEASIGDFYDAYYRQPTPAQNESWRVDVMTVGQALSTNERGNRPVPLKLGGFPFVEETIVEVLSPIPRPVVSREMKRFLTRI